ncbi:peroxiredoxin [bacterium]|nr:peroxiredoxin [FCB group bacterium]MBL7192148.1 peroxiredoxin [bacterium]
MAEELNVRDIAPDFMLESSEGGNFHLEDYRGSIVVLYFYPKDNTPGCTKEACGFRDYKKELEKAGAHIFGVSPDSLRAHDNFIHKFDLNFPLLSDVDRDIAELYDVLKIKKMYGKEKLGIERTTFLIDKEGVIRNIWRKVKVDGHIVEVLVAVKKIK